MGIGPHKHDRIVGVPYDPGKLKQHGKNSSRSAEHIDDRALGDIVYLSAVDLLFDDAGVRDRHRGRRDDHHLLIANPIQIPDFQIADTDTPKLFSRSSIQHDQRTLFARDGHKS
ncbi:hypothetical protein D3C86_1453460 [compost metagenome]